MTAARYMLEYAQSADQLDKNIMLGEATILESLLRFCEAMIIEYGDRYLCRPIKQDFDLF